MADNLKIEILKQIKAMKIVANLVVNLKKTGKDNINVTSVQRRISQWKELSSEIFNRDIELETMITDAERAKCDYFVKNQMEDFEIVATKVLDELDAIMVSLNPISSSNSVTAATGTTIVMEPAIPLPKIEVPRFTGEILDWPAFRDRFTSLIINNRKLTDDQRMHYLVSALTGEASGAIKHLDIRSDHFAIAWKILVHQYENEREIIFTSIERLLNLPKVTPKSAESLRKLREEVNTIRHALVKQHRDLEKLNDIFVYVVTTRLDDASREAWETVIGNDTKVPKYENLDQFLDSRNRVVKAITITASSDASSTVAGNQGTKSGKSNNSNDTTANGKGNEKNSKQTSKSQPRRVTALTVNTQPANCFVCKQPHATYRCPKFAKHSVEDRTKLVQNEKRCYNCLGLAHTVNQCTSIYRCKQCGRKHHTLLHLDSPSGDVEKPNLSTETEKQISVNHVSCPAKKEIKTVMLATARAQCYSPQGHSILVRILLDQGSEATLISEKLAQTLRLPRIRALTHINGAADTNTISKFIVRIGIGSSNSVAPVMETDAIVVKSVTRLTRDRPVCRQSLAHLEGIQWAEDDPFNTDPIDILIGADLYSAVFLDGVKRGKTHEPMAQETIFGWVITGPLNNGKIPDKINTNVISLTALENTIKRFWEIENLPTKQHLTDEESMCEEHFIATHSRNEEGRYIVRFPFKTASPPSFVNTRDSAFHNLTRMERKLATDPAKEKEYREFMDEYETLGHMKKIENVPKKDISTEYYIPHHAVIRETSVTTRLRVVFNASARDTSGRSLNDELLAGPKLQTDLIAILLRWRQHRCVMSADIAKMYRQILIHPEDVDYQRILWRSSSSQEISPYHLLTVTYGTTSAPYQAIRVLHQLTADEGQNHPLAVPVIMRQTYVDDCLFGADSVDETVKIRDDTRSLLLSGGFDLRKWAANNSELLTGIDPSNYGLAQKELKWDEELKILGLSWQPEVDAFRIKINLPNNIIFTKRGILSVIARMFDPLGWLTPTVIATKILMQDLWRLRCEWDDALPASIVERWSEFLKQIKTIEAIEIPRWTEYRPQNGQVELHGFADASTAAYAAAIYMRFINSSGSASVSLVLAKSKVAPMQTVSVPRLELCAALLVSKLMKYVRDALELHNATYYCWSDSTVVLSWLSKPPSTWTTFVANRVSKIVELTKDVVWQHITTTENPADCASRGITPCELKDHSLWWSGPPWLSSPQPMWPTISPSVTDEPLLEARTQYNIHNVTLSTPWEIRDRFSSWTRLLRITALILKFLDRIRRRTDRTKAAIPLTATDISRARTYWHKTIQYETFQTEITILKSSKSLPRNNQLIALNPYIDEDGVLRARGRLRHSDLNNAAKYPIILKSHPLVKLLIKDVHQNLLHSGPRLTLSHIRQRYWILRVRNIVREVLYSCVKCAREKARCAEQLMGDLPDFRVTATSRAFIHTGVDYAGPISIRYAPGRGIKIRKAYIAVFICLTTKAIHLELVSDCTTCAFLAAYQRFTTRRGIPSDMYSDNGTNFHGADRELTIIHRSAINDPTITHYAANTGVKWHFIPPSAPHFGGLWEAAVRSMKYHLRRCTSTRVLTIEEMTTLLCKIEACLNSRPLSALPDDIDNYQILTPGHFLIGSSIVTPPEPSLLDVSENRLTRWQEIHRLTEQFWRSWRKEYLHTLQQRPKWRTRTALASVGRIVIIHDASAPPTHWPLGRIIQCHPGPDGITRVVTIKTQSSMLKRPITKLTFLPIDINEQNEIEQRLVTAGGLAPETQ